MHYTFQQIASITAGTILQQPVQEQIDHLLIDSRRIGFPITSLFFAIRGPRRNGHNYIEAVYQAGVRSFVVDEAVDTRNLPEAGFIKVRNTVQALQQLAAHHRSRFQLPVIGITGSNGKTIVKEWLNQLLAPHFNIVRSPKSFNSQIGVPLSLWLIQPHHNLGIFEAGISTTGEMERLAAMIAPETGIFTNIGEAHSEGFAGTEEKIAEKLQLFRNSRTLIYCGDDERVQRQVLQFQQTTNPGLQLFCWSMKQPANLQVTAVHKAALPAGTYLPKLREGGQPGAQTTLTALHNGREISIQIPFTDDASVENAIACWCLLLQPGFENVDAAAMSRLQPVAMRLEQKNGINNCILINDSYSADLSSLQLALDYLVQQNPFQQKTVILSDILQSGRSQEALYAEVARLLLQKQISRFIGIGHALTAHRGLFEQHRYACEFYTSVQEFKQYFNPHHFSNEVILLKGARLYGLETIVQLLEEKVHQTVLEIHLDRLVHNLKAHQQLLHPGTKTMAIVKAFSYGSGSQEVARVLQFHKTDYLAVAYADEGVELRQAGIHLPIMVMNADEAAFDALARYDLEPELYSPAIMQAFLQYLERNALQQFPVHIKFDSGMHRLGFTEAGLPWLKTQLERNNAVAIQSVFSHLAGSEDPALDDFTRQQYQRFMAFCNQLETITGKPFLKHIANSAAIARHPWLQCNMVRLGIGMYGEAPQHTGLALQQVCELKTTIAQLKHLQPGDTVGYGRRGRVEKPSTIATVRIGYADGYPRSLGNGRGFMLVNGHPAPVIGNVCMDMTMLDVTGIPNVHEGGSVLVFGGSQAAGPVAIGRVAAWAGTISYEILAGISQRVKRVYFGE